MQKHQLNQEKFIERAVNAHGERYAYEKSAYQQSKKKIIVTCPEHGDFEIRPFALWRGDGCPECHRNWFINNDISINDYILMCRKKYGDRFDYNKLKRNKKIIVSCKHGEFETSPAYHLKYPGCKECGKELKREAIIQSNKKRKKTIEEFIIAANKKHNFKYTYEEADYQGINRKVKITCPNHGTFIQNPSDHLQGNGCQKCAMFSTSKLEQEWLLSKGISEDKWQKWITIKGKRLKVDGLDKKTNTIYEFFGDFWHGNINNPKYLPGDINPKNKISYGKLYENTLKRIDSLRENGYNVIVMWEYDWLKNDDTQLGI